MEAAGELTGQDVLVAVLALVLWPLPFQPFVQVLHLLLLQTLGAGGGGQWASVPQGCPWGRNLGQIGPGRAALLVRASSLHPKSLVWCPVRAHERSKQPMHQ